MSATTDSIDVRGRFAGLARDYAQLTKARITLMIVFFAACGYVLGAHKTGAPVLSWGLLQALLGIGLASAGTAALNEVMERDVDRLMQRTSRRPLPAGRMTVAHAALLGVLLTLGGSAYLVASVNLLTGLLTFATALVYLAAYTPLKRLSPVCTSVGALPGAMPAVLGWAAVRGRLDAGAFVLFAILFVWQFPHFLSIAWLYREDYLRGKIRMLPVVDAGGRSTVWRILGYSAALIPISLLPVAMGMSGRLYLVGAAILGGALLWVAMAMAYPLLSPASPASKPPARRLLRATIAYLPILFVLMLASSGH